MERHANFHEQLFSRGSATPPLPSQSQLFAINSSSSSPNQLDSLFQSISTSDSIPHGGSNSAPATPSMAMHEDGGPTGSSPPPTSAEKQSALLSLLYPSASSAPPSSQVPLPATPQQVSTPPTAHRTGPSPPNSSETQGKILLEQLMVG